MNQRDIKTALLLAGFKVEPTDERTWRLSKNGSQVYCYTEEHNQHTYAIAHPDTGYFMVDENQLINKLVEMEILNG